MALKMNPLSGAIRLSDRLVCRAFGWFAVGMVVIAAAATLGGIRATTALSALDIKPELGRAFIVRPAISRWLVIPAGDWLGRMQGPARLHEDDRALGPGRQLHQSIRDEANGLFALDQGYLRFAASDGSDPRTNGRAYTLNTAVNPGVIPWLVILLGLATATIRLVATAIGRDAVPTGGRFHPAAAAISAVLGAGAMTGTLMTAGALTVEIRTPPLVALCLVTLGLVLVVPLLWPMLRHDLKTEPASRRRLHQALWALAALGAAMLVYGAVFATGLITFQNQIDKRAISPGGGEMFVAALPAPPLGLGYQEFWRSPLVAPTRITEDGREIGIGSSVHAWIVERGGGRFSIFGGNLLFSTPDNSDPRDNGRHYEVTTPLLPTSSLFLLALLLICGSLFGFRQLGARAANRPTPIQQAHWLAVIAAFLLTVFTAGLLWRHRPDLYPHYPLSGIALWFAPLVLVALVLLMIRRLRGDPARLPTVFGIAAAFFTTAVLTLAGLTPLLDNLLLADAFGSVHYDGSQILSMIHANDSATYISSATQLVLGGSMDGIGSNRPINATILAFAFRTGDANVLAMLFLRASFMAFAIVIASYEVAKSFGWTAALLFGAFNTLFAAEFVQSALSEPNGLAWACLGIALMVRAFRLHSFWLLMAAIGLVTVAMMTRPGAMLTLPALIAFAWWERRYFKVSGAVAATASVVVMLIALQLSAYLNWALNAPTRTLLSNFPHTLYGLASGGKGWLQITIDHPDLTTPAAMLAAAIHKIWSEPHLILKFLWSEFLDFWPFTFQLTKVDLFFALTLLGVLVAVTTLRSIYSRLIIVIAASTWISAPIVMNDGGYRVFAASVPFFALMAIWPLFFFDRAQTLGHVEQAWYKGDSGFRIFALFRFAGISGVTAVAAIAMLLSAPLVFLRLPPDIMTRQLMPSCAPNEKSIIVRGSATSHPLHIISDDQPRSVVPHVRESAFHNHMALNAPAILAHLGRIPAGSTVTQVNEPREGGKGTAVHLVFFMGRQQVIGRDQLVEICADPIPARFNDSLEVSRGLRIINRS